MRTGRLIVLLFFLASGLLASDEEEACLWAKQIMASMKSVRTFQCNFEQTKRLGVLEHTLTIKGILCVDRIGKIAWHVIEPMQYSCILADDHLTQWDADSNKEIRISIHVHPALTVFSENMRAYFSGDMRPLLQKYHASIPRKGVMEFKPKKGTIAAKVISRVEITPSSDESYIRSVSVYELNGDVTRLAFYNIRLNEPIAPALWRIQSK